MSKSSWSTTAADWDQRFEVGDVVADPSGSWEPSTAQEYIDSQIAGVNTNLASETIARQAGDSNLSTQLQSEMGTRASQDANLNALINAGIREGGGVEFDIVPTQNSANGITSGGMYSTLRDSNIGFVDSEPTAGSDNLVKSYGVKNDLFYLNDTRSVNDMILGTGHMVSDNKWNYVGDALNLVIRIKQGDVLTIRRHPGYSSAVYAILKSYFPKNGDRLDLATGESGRHTQSGTDWQTININSADAKYLCALVKIPSVSTTQLYTPDIIINGYDYSKSVHEYIKDSKFVIGTQDEITQDVPSTSFSNNGFYYTFVGVFSSNNDYNTTGYLQVDASESIHLNTIVPTTISAITIFNEDYNLIGFVGGTTDEITVSEFNIDLINYPNVKYVRFTGKSGTTHNGYLYTKSISSDDLFDKTITNEEEIKKLDSKLGNFDENEAVAINNNSLGIFRGTYSDGYISSANIFEFFGVSEHTSKHIIFSINPGDVITIKRGYQPAVFAILSKYSVPQYLGSKVFYATGETRTTISDQDIHTITVTAEDAKYLCIVTQYDSSNYIPSILTINGHDLIRSSYNVRPSAGVKNFMGHVPTTNDINPEKYTFITFYGQSLSNGSESVYHTDPVVRDCYMLGNISGTSSTLVPLQLNSGVQDPSVSCVNSLATLAQKYYNSGSKFIAGSFGVGSRSIAQLSKASRIQEYAQDYSYSIKDSGAYESRFLAGLNNAVTAVGVNRLECPVIVYLQGEKDYVPDQQQDPTAPITVDAAYACNGDKAMYKSRMRDLKNDMQTDIITKFRQTYKPMFCIYQVTGPFIKNDQMTINMAQIEFAEENDDVFLMQAPYFTPNYTSGHLSTNGYRWYGEVLAKALYNIIYQNSYWKPILPYQFKVEGTKIIISLENYVGKLYFDTSLETQQTNYGFAVFLNGTYSASNISSIEIDDNHIIITCNQTLAGKTVEVVYGGNKTSGSGNLRDSDVYQAMYTYLDDSSDKGTAGTSTIYYRPSIIGQKYPMYNWLASFYKLVQE